MNTRRNKMNKHDYKDPDTFTLDLNEPDYEAFYQDNDDVLWGKPEKDPIKEFIIEVANFRYESEVDNYFELMQLIGKAKDLLKENYNGR